MTRREFPAKIKLLAFKRACRKPYEPHCEKCGKRIRGLVEYDHIIPDGLGGEPTLENCQVLCGQCHRLKTHTEDRPIMAKADRQMKAAANIKPKRRVMAGSRSSRWKKKLSGETVLREEKDMDT